MVLGNILKNWYGFDDIVIIMFFDKRVMYDIETYVEAPTYS